AGSAGSSCSAGFVCSGGSCAPSCLAGQVLCGSKCVDPGTDRAFCGATAGCGVGGVGSAGATCGAGQICSGGTCDVSCAAPLVKCTPTSGGPYCTATAIDPANCGACGNVCPVRANAKTVCAAASCAFVCNAGFTDCNGVAADGCEINTASDKNNCGKCGNVCPGTCSSGTCTLAPTCALLVTNANMWGSPARGLALSAYTSGTLDWIGCMGNGCSVASFFCTDEVTGIYFGTTDIGGSALRALVDPGNAGGDTYPTTHTGCSTAGTPRSLSNAPNALNSGVGGINAGDALCKAMGFASGGVVATQSGNACPRPHTTTPTGSNWTSTWSGSDGIWGQTFRCFK
ncbi:MAG: hypothetical protein HYV09_29740, partial [Deltaproteobacteria bacterium]|nr:hypothetical protein [Deltaproteobacteria bacterium]